MLVACLAACRSAWAVAVIDQNQPNNAAFLAGFSQPDLAQSFQQTNANIAGAGIFLQPFVGTPGVVTITLWDALPNAGGNALASASASGAPGNWVDVFWSPISIIPATTYFLVFTSNNSTLGISGDVNPYANGQAYANAGFQPFPLFDYTFRTYYDNQFSPQVPEGGWTIAVFAMGLVAVLILRSRSRQQTA